MRRIMQEMNFLLKYGNLDTPRVQSFVSELYMHLRTTRTLLRDGINLLLQTKAEALEHFVTLGFILKLQQKRRLENNRLQTLFTVSAHCFLRKTAIWNKIRKEPE